LCRASLAATARILESSKSATEAEVAFERIVHPRWKSAVEQDIRLLEALVEAAVE